MSSLSLLHCMLLTASIVVRFLVFLGLVEDCMNCCGRAMCPFTVAIDSGKYFLTASDVKPGHDTNWSLSIALHHIFIVGKKHA
jgi:hypothetical protein